MQGEICVCPRVIKSQQHYLAWRRNYAVGHAWRAESMDKLALDWEGRQGCLEQSRPPTESCVLLEIDKGRGVCSVQRAEWFLGAESRMWKNHPALISRACFGRLVASVRSLRCARPGLAPESLLGPE